VLSTFYEKNLSLKKKFFVNTFTKFLNAALSSNKFHSTAFFGMQSSFRTYFSKNHRALSICIGPYVIFRKSNAKKLQAKITSDIRRRNENMKKKQWLDLGKHPKMLFLFWPSLGQSNYFQRLWEDKFRRKKIFEKKFVERFLWNAQEFFYKKQISRRKIFGSYFFTDNAEIRTRPWKKDPQKENLFFCPINSPHTLDEVIVGQKFSVHCKNFKSLKSECKNILS